jgi:hypothetical protein
MSKQTDAPMTVKKINWKGQIQKVTVLLSEPTKKKKTFTTKEKNDEKPYRIKGQLE